MEAQERLERVERWAEKVLEDSHRLSPDLSEEEVLEQQVRWYADYYALDDDALPGDPGDPETRTWLIEEEGLAPELADQVLAKVKELAAAH